MDVLRDLIGYRTSIWMFYGFLFATELLYGCFMGSHWLQNFYSIWMFYGFSLATELLYVLRDLIGCYIFYRCFTSSHWLQHLVITLAHFCRHFKIDYLFLGATFFSTYLCPFLDVCVVAVTFTLFKSLPQRKSAN